MNFSQSSNVLSGSSEFVFYLVMTGWDLVRKKNGTPIRIKQYPTSVGANPDF